MSRSSLFFKLVSLAGCGKKGSAAVYPPSDTENTGNLER